ncbi:Ribosome recycling factor [Tripterygium wilfordii]|uniref:Ribosome-recycling factor, chloroplastic n=1 Tax=Tripterygium wilfordii TaxID=458696 RepID=A0A7J7D287_TRIWF|nr:ribosome-recycling factor [Tripterygium wilfordii]KAF5740472.1 Ribosome recycling factor [Tripterygium wilfordii]
MALYLRRALFLNRNAFLLVRASSFQSRNLSHILCYRTPRISDSHKTEASILPTLDFIGFPHRGFAKKSNLNKSNDLLADQTAPHDFGPNIKATAVSQMEAAVEALSRELTKLRTGRASAGMLDHIIVETGGLKMQLNRLAVVSVMDPKTLSINPYDPNTLKEIEKAITSSPLGLNPKVDGQRLIASIPPLTKEHMQAICKVVTKSCEDVKQSIRRARQKALDTIKKAGSIFPKDEAKRLEKEVDDLTKKFIKSVEDMGKSKEREITQG